MRRWVAQDLHRTLTTAIDHLTGGGLDAGSLLDDLRYHAGLLGCRLAAHPTTPTAHTTTADKDPT